MDKLQTIMPEYVILEKLKDEIEVGPATKDEVAPFIQKHYLQKFPTGTKKMYGIFRKQSHEMIGMIMYGQPFPTVAKALSKLVKPNEILELKRLFIDDVGLRNAESFVIGQSLKLLQHDLPEVKIIITFADSKAGHVGGIYQATNATYIGQSADGKHRYLYFLGKDADKMKAMVDQKPYPKKDQPVTQLDKAIQEAEAHFPGNVRMNQSYFGMVKTNHLTGKCEWVMEAANKSDPKQDAAMRMFMYPFYTFAQKYLTSSNVQRMLETDVVVRPQQGIISQTRVALAVFIPEKLFRGSVLEEIKDNPTRAARDMASTIERANHLQRMSLDLEFSQMAAPGYVSIHWDAKTPGHVDPMDVDPSRNE